MSRNIIFFSRNISEFAYLYEIITDGKDIFEQLKSLAMVSPGGWEKPYLYLLRLKTRVSSIAEETDWAESKTVDRSLMELLVNGKVHVDTLYQLTGLQYPWMAICESYRSVKLWSKTFFRSVRVSEDVY